MAPRFWATGRCCSLSRTRSISSAPPERSCARQTEIRATREQAALSGAVSFCSRANFNQQSRVPGGKRASRSIASIGALATKSRHDEKETGQGAARAANNHATPHVDNAVAWAEIETSLQVAKLSILLQMFYFDIGKLFLRFAPDPPALNVIFVVTDLEADLATFRSQHEHMELVLDRAAAIVSPSRNWAEEVYGWGTPEYDATALVTNLRDMFVALGGAANLGRGAPAP